MVLDLLHAFDDQVAEVTMPDDTSQLLINKGGLILYIRLITFETLTKELYSQNRHALFKHLIRIPINSV